MRNFKVGVKLRFSMQEKKMSELTTTTAIVAIACIT